MNGSNIGRCLKQQEKVKLRIINGLCSRCGKNFPKEGKLKCIQCIQNSHLNYQKNKCN